MRFNSAPLNTLLLALSLRIADAQFPPKPEGVTVLRSKFHENVTISFKEPGICETTPGVKSYSGYVHLPPGFLNDGGKYGEAQDYPINTFFWFFEARNRPAAEAPLAIWLNGGPGASSLTGLLQGNGPCLVADDSAATHLNPWSWNSEVNTLYVDQPAQVGFSYDVPTNATVRLRSRRRRSGGDEEEEEEEEDYYEIVPTNFTTGGGGGDADLGKLVNLTSGVGTFGSQRADRGANTTTRAAHALWHFAQAWFGEFPHYKPRGGRVSLWTEGYGGHYGPGFARLFREMNEKIAGEAEVEGETDTGGGGAGGAHYLHLDTLGIVNGDIDLVTQMESYISFPSYNTYNIHIFDPALEGELYWNWTRPHGCKSQVLACADYLRDHDPPSLGLPSQQKNLSEVCTNATAECATAPWAAYGSLLPADSARGRHDIAHPKHDPFPPPHYLGYLRQARVQAALGVPVNFTPASHPARDAFGATFDPVRGGFLGDVAWLLDEAGVSVHLVYGDRDYASNWVGGEAASLAVPHKRRAEFAREAGYAQLMVESGASGGGGGELAVAGLTRQLGNLSFTRVFQAGHMVPAYQPAAAHAVFTRAVFGRDVATGRVPVDEGYRTSGARSTWDWWSLEPPFPNPRCYVLEPRTCVPEVWERVKKGAVRVRDWFVVDDDVGSDDGKNKVLESVDDGNQAIVGEL